MPHERFFIDTPLNACASVLLEGKEFHHFQNVMRMKEGDPCEIVNGQGFIAEAVTESITKKGALLIISNTKSAVPSSNSYILAQALPRMNRLDTIIEKTTELGADEIWLFSSDKSERGKLESSTMERLTAIAISAMKQSGRLYLPQIKFFKNLKELLQHVPKASSLLFGDFSDKSKRFKDLELLASCLFLVGPESGLSQVEEELLWQSGFQGVQLHKNVLRTDTAAITALSILYELTST